jgi:hypothetical protein
MVVTKHDTTAAKWWDIHYQRLANYWIVRNRESKQMHIEE